MNLILEENQKLNPADQKVSAEYAILNYKNSNKEIRDEAYSIIMKLYRSMGAKIKSYLSDVRKAQLDLLQEGFDEIDGVDPNKKSKAPPSEPTITTNIDPMGP